MIKVVMAKRATHDFPIKRQKELRVCLEEEILEGKIKPGTFISEREICHRFGVSRTPVREAFLQLALLDLIEFRPRRGAIVRQMSVKQVAAMWEVLTSLEALAAGLAARRMTEKERDHLIAIHKKSQPLVGNRDIDQYDNLNREFHEAIYAGSRNDYLASETRTIRLRLKSYRCFPFQRPGRLQRSFEGHGLVIDAIVAGDDEAAASVMREHVASGLSFLDIVAELPSEALDSKKSTVSQAHHDTSGRPAIAKKRRLK